MAIDFPASPSINDTFLSGSVTYTWDGTKWTAATGSVSLSKIEVGNTKAEIVDTGSDGRFVVTTEGSERCRVDSSGRLLVGTNTARANYFANTSGEALQFQVEGTTFRNSSLSLTCNSSTAAFAPIFTLARSRGDSIGSNTVVSNNDALGSIIFQGNDGSAFVQSATITAAVDGTPGANDMPGRLVFSTTKDGQSSPTNHVRINADGRFDISAASTGYVVSSALGAGTTTVFFAGSHSGTEGTFASGTQSISIFTNGNIQNTNGSYTTLSDAKLKENIVNAGSQWNDLKSIQIRNWNFKKETGHGTHRQIGPIAQELEQVCPGLVFETPDRDNEGNETGEVTKGVNQSVLYMKAVKALQEAMERIETLEAKVAALEA